MVHPASCLYGTPCFVRKTIPGIHFRVRSSLAVVGIFVYQRSLDNQFHAIQCFPVFFWGRRISTTKVSRTCAHGARLSNPRTCCNSTEERESLLEVLQYPDHMERCATIYIVFAEPATNEIEDIDEKSLVSVPFEPLHTTLAHQSIGSNADSKGQTGLTRWVHMQILESR